MQGVTLGVALLVSCGILAAPRRYALPIFVGALAWYPGYLGLSLGTVDFTVGRIAVLALLGKAVFFSDKRINVSWGWVDLCVIFAVVGQCIGGFLTTSNLSAFVENRAGAAFSLALPYFAVRLLVRQTEDYIVLLKSMLVIAAPLALFGAYQCITGHNPLGFMMRYAYSGATVTDRMLPGRLGWWRAEATFGHSITFGLFFAVVGPLCAGLWGYTRRRGLLAAGLALVFVGMLSSMSSGAFLAGIAACTVIVLYRFRRHWGIPVTLAIIWLAAVDIISNRHWYDVLGGLTLNPRTAWYRIKLMRVAFGGGMSGHWVAGFGPFRDPGWGPMIDGMEYTDIVNHYLLILVRYGLLGLLPFLGAVGGALVALRQGYVRARWAADRWLIWGMLSSLTGIVAAMFSVSLMSQVAVLFFILLGLCVNSGHEFFAQSSWRRAVE